VQRWVRNRLIEQPIGVMELPPASVRNLVELLGCSHHELAQYLARFIPDVHFMPWR